MANDPETRDLLIAAGVDPDTENVDLDTVNNEPADLRAAPELYLPRGQSMRSRSPMSPAYDQDRTPWAETDRTLIF